MRINLSQSTASHDEQTLARELRRLKAQDEPMDSRRYADPAISGSGMRLESPANTINLSPIRKNVEVPTLSIGAGKTGRPGYEIRFPGPIDKALSREFGEHGWRYSGFQKLWYCKQSPNQLAFATALVERLGGVNNISSGIASAGVGETIIIGQMDVSRFKWKPSVNGLEQIRDTLSEGRQDADTARIKEQCNLLIAEAMK